MGKSEIKAYLAHLVPGSPFPGVWMASFRRTVTWHRKQAQVSQISLLVETLIPCEVAGFSTSSNPDGLQKAPPPNATSLAVRVVCQYLGDTDMHPVTATSLSHIFLSVKWRQ